MTLVAALAAAAAGCDSPTTLVVTVDDSSAPSFTQLVIKLSSVDDPSHHLSQQFISIAPGYGAEGGLPPVTIPVQETFTVDPSYLSGEVLVEAQGVEIYGQTVVAAGSATVNVVPKQTTSVTVTLQAPGSCGGTSDAGLDAASPCDAGADAQPGG